jgi:uncharacterized protein YacL
VTASLNIRKGNRDSPQKPSPLSYHFLWHIEKLNSTSPFKTLLVHIPALLITLSISQLHQSPLEHLNAPITAKFLDIGRIFNSEWRALSSTRASMFAEVDAVRRRSALTRQQCGELSLSQTSTRP